MNEIQNLLSCWHKLEHFSPANLPKGKNVEELTAHAPWEQRHVLEPNKTIEYSVYLGVFPMSYVTDFIRDFFKDENEDINREGGSTCIASIKLSIEGKVLPNSLGISTLPWALHQLEKGKIDSNNWEDQFSRLQSDLLEELKFDLEDVAHSTESIKKIQSKIVATIGWSIKPPLKILVKREEKFKSLKDDEEKNNTEILNSFYISDIETIIKELPKVNHPNAFHNYLKGCLNQKANNRNDLDERIDLLRNSLVPQNYPDGCWPSLHSLSLMQQYAVNTIWDSLSSENSADILSVNGPPGTGKTTLLRDIVAAILVKRAKNMVKIHDPSNALIKVDELINGNGYNAWVYALDKSLCHSGIVVASSNNGAVENVSKELPLKNETKPFVDQIGYFKQVAESCVDKDNWGLISAVLGNKQNRSKLILNLWFNKDKQVVDLRRYLQLNKLTNLDWGKAVKRFNEKLEQVEQEKRHLTSCIAQYDRLVKLLDDYQNSFLRFQQLENQINEESHVLIIENKHFDEFCNFKEALFKELSLVKSTKPGFFTYIFNKTIRRHYKDAYQSAFIAFTDAQSKQINKRKEIDELKLKISTLEIKKRSDQRLLIELQNSCQQLGKIVEPIRELLGKNFADESYWTQINSKSSQEACPWYSAKLKELQSELFIEAMRLHETFILVANSKSSRIESTLSAFFNYLKGDFKSKPDREVIKAMWDVFFLLVPVVSTTFASVGTMFGDLKKEDLPWLFIDEAGQAVPQAAVGSIWRSKRVVVVGDPLQIEPVTTIPNSILSNVRSYFNLSDEIIHSDLSVQTMADRINKFGANFTSNENNIWVGIPLRVHRRCLNPMFEIANSIAYNNKMVMSTDHSKAVDIELETGFIHMCGTVDGRHWVKEQGDIVIDLLLTEITKARKLPDIFVITPFVEVSYNLRGALFKPLLAIMSRFDSAMTSEIMGDWLNTHVGTVHTFQGKQAQGVILCLGLDVKTRGAANWASKKPNLLNVALTRAKYRFVAIGDQDIWLKVPFFRELVNLN